MHRLVIDSLRTSAGVAVAALCMCGLTARADVFVDDDRVTLQFGPYVYHRNHDSAHNNTPMLLGAEWESESRWELGASYFKNSFYQPCLYIYGGRRWFLRSADDGIFFKLTGGFLYGYKAPYENKVPVNDNGFGLAVIPTVGYQYQRASAQVVVLGTAGLMLMFGYDFWK